MSLLGNIILVLAFLVTGYTILASLLDSRKNKYGFPTNAATVCSSLPDC
jgi:hypothetical protein